MALIGLAPDVHLLHCITTVQTRYKSENVMKYCKAVTNNLFCMTLSVRTKLKGDVLLSHGEQCVVAGNACGLSIFLRVRGVSRLRLMNIITARSDLCADPEPGPAFSSRAALPQQMQGRLKQGERLHQRTYAVSLHCHAVVLMIYSQTLEQRQTLSLWADCDCLTGCLTAFDFEM